MYITAVERQSLAQAVFEQLRDRILAGQFQPGEVLPSERELCEQLEVNRAALREALGRLQAIRLVSTRQGDNSRVLDYREAGGLELLACLVTGPGGDIQTDVIRGLIEMRAALAPDIAASAARRRSPEQVDALLQRIHALEALEDVVERHDEHMALWSTLVDASGNIAYRLMFNSLREAVGAVGDVLAPALVAETEHTEGYVELVKAVKRRRPRAAAKAATDLVARGTRSMVTLLNKLEVV